MCDPMCGGGSIPIEVSSSSSFLLVNALCKSYIEANYHLHMY